MTRTIIAATLGAIMGALVSVSILHSQGGVVDHTVTQAQFDAWKQELPGDRVRVVATKRLRGEPSAPGALAGGGAAPA